MEQDTKSIIKAAEGSMQKCVEHFEDELLKIRAGKASPVILDGLRVEYYGAPTSLNQLANVSAPDAKTLTIQPYDRSLIAPIEKAIMDANLGFTPQNDGIQIRVNLPAMTEERRKQLVKQIKDETEKARVALRNVRRDANEQVKKLTKNGVSEDEVKATEAEIQKLTDKYIATVDRVTAAKEQEVMTV